MNRLLIIYFLLIAQMGLAQRAVPPLWGHRVHDDAKVLHQETIDQLESLLKQHEDSTSNQIAILIISTLEGDDLESYSLRVAEEWKLGTANNDNGILFLIVVDDRKMRIEVGQGLEGVLPDATASQIIRNEVAPYFREQNYDQGVTAGTNAIIKAIANEYSVVSADGGEVSDLTTTEKIIFGLLLLVVLGTFTFIALVSPGCGGWGLYAFLIPFYLIFPTIILGTSGGLGLLGSYVFGLPILKLIIGRTAWGKKIAKKMENEGDGNFTRRGWSSGSGWFSGGSGGWSSGSSGGFSGGGGSFGGGGSSGSW